MLELIVDTTNPTPPYEQLRRQLADLISAGALPAGERLPPLRQLAGDLGLAVGTVARTYRELETAGLITSRRGGGTRVATPPAGTSPAVPDSLRSGGSPSPPPTLVPPSPSPSPSPSPFVPSLSSLVPPSLSTADSSGESLRVAAETYVREARALGAGGADIVVAVQAALELKSSRRSG